MLKRILLAEDEEALRMLVADTLEDEGYEIVEACDGVEAYEKLCRETFDLVLLDYMMPGMTGLEVTEKARQLPGGAELKIMMLTARTQKSDQDRARQAGVTYFMSKPFSPVELAHVIGEILSE